MAPSVLTVNLIVFGKQMRAWMLQVSSACPCSALLDLGGGVCGRDAHHRHAGAFHNLSGGASRCSRLVHPEIARRDCSNNIVLWWAASAGLGFYLRHVPYSLVYGGLGCYRGPLMLWMQFTATILGLSARPTMPNSSNPKLTLPFPREYTEVKSV